MKRERDDHAIFELADDGGSHLGKTVKVTFPSKVLRIHDRNELLSQLQHYSRPFIKHLVPDSQFARLHYLEKVRPALRYYCKKFGVDVPGWLKDDSLYLEKPDDEKNDLFGTTEFDIREFAPLPRRNKGTGGAA